MVKQTIYNIIMGKLPKMIQNLILNTKNVPQIQSNAKIIQKASEITTTSL